MNLQFALVPIMVAVHGVLIERVVCRFACRFLSYSKIIEVLSSTPNSVSWRGQLSLLLAEN